MAQDNTQREYIGDGVYVFHDGYHIWLTTDRSDGRHRIALEPSVLAALNDFAKRLAEEQENN